MLRTSRHQRLAPRSRLRSACSGQRQRRLRLNEDGLGMRKPSRHSLDDLPVAIHLGEPHRDIEHPVATLRRSDAECNAEALRANYRDRASAREEIRHQARTQTLPIDTFRDLERWSPEEDARLLA